ncbi:hypothetical protein AQJ46_45890 [Streptomyces canus]|uniref:Uncharacterized protein n=1 Tax=Streptomyces canus TaxID=58343 RepID=A0A101RLE9_9ACTN|nr:hypothetical protein AQJ46_45890 [Streptomyces canus]
MSPLRCAARTHSATAVATTEKVAWAMRATSGSELPSSRAILAAKQAALVPGHRKMPRFKGFAVSILDAPRCSS